MKSTRIAGVSLLVTAALVLAGIGVTAATASESAPTRIKAAPKLPLQSTYTTILNKYYQAAKKRKENQVVIYGGGAVSLQPAWDIFQKKYPGIKVVPVAIRGSDTVAKVKQESSSGQHVADFVEATGAVTSIILQSGLLKAYRPAVLKGVDPPLVTGIAKVFYAASATPVVIAYNPNKVAASDVPKSWDDLLNPKFKNKLTMGNPGVISVSEFGLGFLYRSGQIDQAWLRRLKDQGPAIAAVEPGQTQVIASSDRSLIVGYPLNWVVADAAKGAPIKAAFPLKGLNVIPPQYWGFLKGAPHPNASMLLLNWLLSSDGQRAVAKTGDYPLMPGAPGPPGYPKLAGVKAVPLYPFSTWPTIDNDNITLFKSIFG